MGNPLFTVVIPTYNRWRMIDTAIRSVMTQTEKNWKMLIIDDASDQDIPLFLKKLIKKDPRITFKRLSKNVGISQVMNHAVRTVSTPYFIQLDSDDWLDKSTLEHFTKAIQEADENTALFYANTAIHVQERGRWKVKKKVSHRQFKDRYDFLTYLTYIISPRCYRTNAVLDVGGWDTSDKFDGRIMEDRRICLKLMEKYPWFYIDRYLYNRTKHRSQLSTSNNIEKRNYLRREVIEHYLKKWGNEYEPVFYKEEDGYLKIEKLIKKG
ncbi:glycosyltransferase family 2 protein [Salipaludibacillus aurantiacus]|uniref:Glycosyltransferase involved in cell wall bisynthesis n=1 Tax=Salipaludibacillus aurantiacus TaxID=1601833 RepID=A0A1H9X6P5_9BACI|nr:glycosyltransferase family 2 protein [Salipaludibacillus aurantiacus]SES41802.1 Glycosyltransferase involved in cell wall bisynthesis [Salipaludibacillus aurantiacus]